MMSEANGPRPQRTRAHIIADLSINYVRWLVLEEGHVADEPDSDYGYDLQIRTFNAAGYVEPGQILLQVKATDHLGDHLQEAKKQIAFAIEARHVRLWLMEDIPVYFILYDALERRAFWLHVQEHFASRPALTPGSKAITLYIPTHQVLDRGTIQEMRARKSQP